MHQARQVLAALQGSLAGKAEALGWDPAMFPEVSPASMLDADSQTDTFRLTSKEPNIIEAVKLAGAAWVPVGRFWRLSFNQIKELSNLFEELQIPVSLEAQASILQLSRGSLFPSSTDVVPVSTPDAVLDVDDDGRPVLRGIFSRETLPNLTRIIGIRWSDTLLAWTAPASRFREVADFASRHAIAFTDGAQSAAAALDAPLTYDSTLNGLGGIPLTDLACMNKSKIERFKEFGLHTVYDLLMLVPRRYIDRSQVVPIASLHPGEDVALIARVTNINVDPRKRMVRFTVSDSSGSLSVTYFNAIWQAKRFRAGDQVVLYGKIEEWQGHSKRLLSMTNPIMDPLGERTTPLIPIYPQSAKSRVTTWELHAASSETIRRLGELQDPIPAPIRERLGLLERKDALSAVHLPSTGDEANMGRRRLAFDELLRMQLALLNSKAKEEAEAGIVHKPTGELTLPFHDSIEFPLTTAQLRAIKEISSDLVAAHPMHRLLQGDVGSGKTMVALTAMLAAVESGYQAALMAPTEILASQLYKELVERTTSLTQQGKPLRIEFFSNKLRGKARAAVLKDLAEGNIDLAVGTHALIVEDVNFHSLGLVVIDEQHRFGVEQRANLRNKGANGHKPDMLVMTATPIPRTAAMTAYGDLDISVLDELPPGRTPIQTEWIDAPPELSSDLADPWPLILDEVNKGRQAYVVCPLVEESEKLQAASATATYEQLQAGALSGVRVGLVHGQQKSEEREATMSAFRSGDLDVLVATTVIEVGVNVPNATVITVLDAPRFGIAQLHQLRGRVGRGKFESRCVLVGRGLSDDSRERMRALCASTDGFYLSEVDLHLRGHGSVFGTSQSGMSDLRVADLRRDAELLTAAREEAIALLQADPGLARRPGLRMEIIRYLGPNAQQWLSKS